MRGIAVISCPNSPIVPHPHPHPHRFSPSKRPLTSFIHIETLDHPPRSSLLSRSSADPTDSPSSVEDGLYEFEPEPELELVSGNEEIEIEVEKVGKMNRRRIQSTIRIDADLDTVWRVLTDYEGLADFIPSVAVSQLLDKKEKFARLYQVGQQNLAFGLKFNAKGVIDCFERDLQLLPSGRRRDIEFKMIEGDFDMFEGRWSIEQVDKGFPSDGNSIPWREFQTTLSYFVELEPKLWLPVRLIEGRLCRDVKANLVCVRDEAHRVQSLGS